MLGIAASLAEPSSYLDGARFATINLLRLHRRVDPWLLAAPRLPAATRTCRWLFLGPADPLLAALRCRSHGSRNRFSNHHKALGYSELLRVPTPPGTRARSQSSRKGPSATPVSGWLFQLTFAGSDWHSAATENCHRYAAIVCVYALHEGRINGRIGFPDNDEISSRPPAFIFPLHKEIG
jgi:hypothetical protein